MLFIVRYRGLRYLLTPPELKREISLQEEEEVIKDKAFGFYIIEAKLRARGNLIRRGKAF